MENQQQSSGERHLTTEQREEISAGVDEAVTGPVSMTAAPSDKEAVCYQGEIASVLEDMGCEVEIDNPTKTASVPELPKGVELTIKETTIRPIHAFRILRAFRRAGVAIATRINGRRGKNDTLYITVGANQDPNSVPPIPTAIER